MTQFFPEWILSNGSTDFFHQDATSEPELTEYYPTDLNKYACIWFFKKANKTKNKKKGKSSSGPLFSPSNAYLLSAMQHHVIAKLSQTSTFIQHHAEKLAEVSERI